MSYRGGGKVGRKWKVGGEVSYFQYHLRVRTKRGRPQHCEKCGTTDPETRYEWANLTGKFEDINDYIRLCVTCHRRRDLGKLTDEDVAAIQVRIAEGYPRSYIAEVFKVDPSLISRIVRGQRRHRRSHHE